MPSSPTPRKGNRSPTRRARPTPAPPAPAAGDRQRLELLYKLGQDLSSRLEPQTVYVAIHSATAQLMPSESFTITLLDEVRNEIELVYAFDRAGPAPRMRVPLGTGVSGQVIATGQPFYVADLLAQGGQPYSVQYGDTQPVRSAI